MNRNFRREATEDVRNAYDWYQDKLPGLGDEFLDELEETLDQVAEFPWASPQVHRNVRQRVMSRFPHKILYTVESDQILVLAVFHARRDPEIWQRRPDE